MMTKDDRAQQDQPASSASELQVRWDKLRVANVYDVLAELGYRDQCLDLRIRPLFPRRHLAGQAVTVRGARDPRSRAEMEQTGQWFDITVEIRKHLFPACVVVVESGGEIYTGKFGEMTSWNLRQGGAKGIVLDAYIRDWLGLEVIPDFTPCAYGTSPIESLGLWYPRDVNVPISMPGTSSSSVRVDPGDWIVGGPDGVVVVPQKVAMEVLPKAEDLERREEAMRRDLAEGVSFDEAFARWGRA